MPIAPPLGLCIEDDILEFLGHPGTHKMAANNPNFFPPLSFESVTLHRSNSVTLVDDLFLFKSERVLEEMMLEN